METIISIDLNVAGWKLPEVRAYRAAVGVNPEYAASQIEKAIEGIQKEARAEFGESVDKKNWEPPDGWMPDAMLNIDPDYILGFAWVGHRRTNPGVKYADYADTISYGMLVDGFWSALQQTVEEAAPLEEAPKRKSPRSKTASPSATSSAGPSTNSTDSPSPSTSPSSDS